jgi:hypothetical protein
MNSSAKVLSVQALKDFRVSFCTFAEEARNALSGVEMELRRMRDWLEREQLSYWRMQVKRRHEEMMIARTELHRRKISQQGSDAVSDSEQREALRTAQRRLHVAEGKVETVRKLIPILHHVIAEYKSHAQPLGDHLSGGMEKSIAALERTIETLEEYLAIAPPAAPRFTASDEAEDMATARAKGPASAQTQPEAESSGQEESARPAGEAHPRSETSRISPADAPETPHI